MNRKNVIRFEVNALTKQQQQRLFILSIVNLLQHLVGVKLTFLKMSQLYTMDEVRPHNGKNGTTTWIVLHDSVYDVTDYLDDHPGGAELITDVAGRNATNEYDDSGHSSDAKQILKKYKIGELVETDKKANRKKKTTLKTIEDNGTEVIKRRKWFRFFFCS